MPTLKHPPSNGGVSEAPGLRHPYIKALSTQTHSALAVIAVLGVIILLIIHWRRSQSCVPRLRSSPRTFDIKYKPPGNLRAFSHSKRGPVLPSIVEKDWQELDPSSESRGGRQPPHEVCAAGYLPVGVQFGQLKPVGKLPTMVDNDGRHGEDQPPGSAQSSRAVSTTDPGRQPDPSLSGPSTVTTRSRTRPPSQVSSVRRLSGSPDGIDGQLPKGKGKGPMAGHSDQTGGFPGMALQSQAEPLFDDNQVYGHTARNAPFPGLDFATPRQFSRPPPPPPLIPPALHSAMFPFEDRRPSYAVSIHPELDASFIHQPNPEYSGCSTSMDVLSSSPQSATAIPRRRSYTKSVPIGIPIPNTTSASSSTETVTSRGSRSFFPSSYPPTSPILPPPPPGQDGAPPPIPPPPPPEYVFVGGPGGPGVFLSQQEIDVQGEIISVMDDVGHGWKRHTRVYGGGVCLACVAAQGRGESEGGFYGDKVPLADRR